jgi:hypothetical protein
MVGVELGVGVIVGSRVGVAVGVSGVAVGVSGMAVGVSVGVGDGAGAPQYSRISGSAPGAAVISEHTSSVIGPVSIAQAAWPSSTRSLVVAELRVTLIRAGTSVTPTGQAGTTNW